MIYSEILRGRGWYFNLWILKKVLIMWMGADHFRQNISWNHKNTLWPDFTQGWKYYNKKIVLIANSTITKSIELVGNEK